MPMKMIHSLPLLALLALTGCSGEDTSMNDATATSTVTATASESATGSTTMTTAETSESTGESTDATSSETGTTTATTGMTTTTTGVSATDTTTDDTTTDMTTTGDTTTTTTGEPEGCTKVDFLFVIDNSVSMKDQQAALKAAFPDFIATIKETLPTDDYHIMIADSDAEGRCAPGVCSHATCQPANKYACKDIFTECDTVRGAGVNHPAGEAASNMLCEFDGGNRYMLSSDPNLEANFSCAASVGLAGHPQERPMDGIVEAISAPLNGPGGCNEGFLRDDAILVVTFLSDDPNVEDQNSALDTYEALVAAKNGDDDRIVMLGLIPQPDDNCGKGGAHWSEMIGYFGPRGIEGPVCAQDYNPFFQDAVSTILDTCVINPG